MTYDRSIAGAFSLPKNESLIMISITLGGHMLSLPDDVSVKYTLPSDITKSDQLVDDLHNHIDFVVLLFNSIPSQEGWLKEEENQVLALKCLTRLEGLALEGKLDPSTARKVYAAVVEGGFRDFFSNVTCRFDKKSEQHFNKFLFNSICEHSRSGNFQRMLDWGGSALAFRDGEYESVQYVSEWFKNGQLSLEKVEAKDVSRVIGELLRLTTEQKIDEMSSQLLTYVMTKLTVEQKIDVALYVGTKDMLGLANGLLTEYCPGIVIHLEENKACRFVVSDTARLKELWVDKNGTLSQLFEVLLKHDLRIFLRLEVNLCEQGAIMLSMLFCSLGDSVNHFSVSFQEAKVDDLNTAVCAVRSMLGNMPKLQYLHIEGRELDVLSVVHFEKIGSVCPAVSSLAFDNCSHANKEFFIGMLDRCGKSLRHLRVNNCGSFDDDVGVAIGTLCPNIEVFYFDSGSLDSEWDISEEAVVTMFGACKVLKTLQFYNSENVPPCDDNPYDLGVINVLQKKYPDRVIHFDYDFKDYY
jgi:hypothetical protein